jgi:hypothetical protein
MASIVSGFESCGVEVTIWILSLCSSSKWALMFGSSLLPPISGSIVPWRWRQYFPLKLHPPTRRQNTMIGIFSSTKISALIYTLKIDCWFSVFSIHCAHGIVMFLHSSSSFLPPPPLYMFAIFILMTAYWIFQCIDILEQNLASVVHLIICLVCTALLKRNMWVLVL